MQENKKITIITGHYGTGKTNIAINLALLNKQDKNEVVLVDLDIVNPYFSATDSTNILIENGIRVISPNFANTNLDMPSLSAKINSIFNQKEEFIYIDVGGDDAGATALGRYASKINKFDYDFFYVINQYRPLIKEPLEAVKLLRDIENASGLKATAIINNSSLGENTKPMDILNSFEYAKKVSEISNLPIKYCTALNCFKKKLEKEKNMLFIELYTKRYW